MKNRKENPDKSIKMNDFRVMQITAASIVLLLASTCSTNPVTIKLSTNGGDAITSGRSSLALYQAPPTYNKEPGKPRLNSIIIKSKPYHVNDSFNFNDRLHQVFYFKLALALFFFFSYSCKCNSKKKLLEIISCSTESFSLSIQLLEYLMYKKPVIF